jgi:DNA processing protein
METNRAKYVLALRHYAGVGPRTFQMLTLRFGATENILEAGIEELTSLPRIGPQRAQRILEVRDYLEEAEKILEEMAARGINVTTVLDEGYPDCLLELADPPPLFYFKGRFEWQARPRVAVVGTTEASQEGLRYAVDIAGRLSELGVTVVSGLARGIDTAAHLGSLNSNGKTYAVLGSGFDKIYPPENIRLSELVAESGVLLTEFLPDTPVSVGGLMSRNRLVVGLSQAVVVVETKDENKDKSGSIDAVNRARQQGKPVYILDPERKLTSEDERRLNAQRIDGVEDIDTIVRYLV